MTWEPGDITLSNGGLAFASLYTRAGYVFRGLGIYQMRRASPKGRRPPTYALIHLNTGHRICNITAPMRDAFEMAHDIAQLGDWTFDGLDGWKNMDPELPDKVHAYMAQHPKAMSRSGSGTSSKDAAMAILDARQAAMSNNPASVQQDKESKA